MTGNESGLGLDLENENDAFGNLEQMGIFHESKNFLDLIENMVYE
jgi:hypothetical protein